MPELPAADARLERAEADLRQRERLERRLAWLERNHRDALARVAAAEARLRKEAAEVEALKQRSFPSLARAVLEPLSQALDRERRERLAAAAELERQRRGAADLETQRLAVLHQLEALGGASGAAEVARRDHARALAVRPRELALAVGARAARAVVVGDNVTSAREALRLGRDALERLDALADHLVEVRRAGVASFAAGPLDPHDGVFSEIEVTLALVASAESKLEHFRQQARELAPELAAELALDRGALDALVGLFRGALVIDLFVEARLPAVVADVESASERVAAALARLERGFRAVRRERRALDEARDALLIGPGSA